MNIIGMIEKATNVLAGAPTDLESFTPGQVQQIGYASFIVAKSERIRAHMGKYANASAVKAQSAVDYAGAQDVLAKAQAYQLWRGASRKLSAVKRLEVLAAKMV